jgi:hypothetical protein
LYLGIRAFKSNFAESGDYRLLIPTTMKYNGLKEKLELFAKYVFIYENVIKMQNSNQSFRDTFPSAFAIYEKRMKSIIFETNIKEINKNLFNQTKFYQKEFAQTKPKSNRLSSFCFHLRNSFSHGLLNINGERYNIIDQNRYNKESAFGELDITLVDEFLDMIIKDYEK